MFKIYYNLTKPGIIYGNAITAIAGFFLASKGHIDWRLFLATLLGISLVMAAGCVFNNLLDRDIDSAMERTKNRAIVTGTVSKQSAVIYGSILGLLGAVVLGQYTNHLTLFIALIGLFVYVALYTPLKRRTIYGTLIGAIAGATPPVVGYTAVTNHLDLGAWLLFFILVTWQMPHFYAIAIRRLDEYKSAGIPVLPAKKGIAVTKIYMLLYIIAFVTATSLLTVFGFTGYIYLSIVSLFGLAWLVLCIKGLKAGNDDKLWARQMFKFSLVVLLVFSITVSIGSLFKNSIYLN